MRTERLAAVTKTNLQKQTCFIFAPGERLGHHPSTIELNDETFLLMDALVAWTRWPQITYTKGLIATRKCA